MTAVSYTAPCPNGHRGAYWTDTLEKSGAPSPRLHLPALRPAAAGPRPGIDGDRFAAGPVPVRGEPVIDRLIDRAPLAGPIIGGLFAWWMAWYLPPPGWWADR